MLGSSAEVQSNIEANTHIANLCDLLERIWGHGLRKRDVSVTLPSIRYMYMYFFISLFPLLFQLLDQLPFILTTCAVHVHVCDVLCEDL